MVERERDWLDSAREAFDAGDFASALHHYEHFFDHALDNDPHSLYGVRLSYCLREWADLGSQFPPARERLVEKKHEALQLLSETRNPERFHDYVAICRSLDCRDEPVRQFLSYHDADRALSASIVRFVWEALVDSACWSVCSEYLSNPDIGYEGVVLELDQALQACREEPGLGGEKFESQIKGWYVRDVCNLARVLLSSGEERGWVELLGRVERDLRARGLTDLLSRIEECARSA